VREGHPGRRCRCSLAGLFGSALCFGGLREGGLTVSAKGREWNYDLRLAAFLHLALLFGSAELLGLRNA
jgi:hypothetical protein